MNKMANVQWTAATAATELIAMHQLRAGNMALGAGLYGATGYLFGEAMQRGDGLAVTNGLWNAISNVAGALVGVWMFGESLDTKKWMGLALGTASVILLSSNN